jgi:glycosyltransferase involved in cell wall biosynthesis
MSAPLVSIVTATFGPPRFLAATIDSALAQTLADFELLVGDDSADEATRALVAGRADPRLSYAANERTLGPARNHRRLFARSRGRYLAVLNQDDLWDERFLERLVGALEGEPRAVLAFCDHWLVGEGGERLVAESQANSRRYGRDLLAPGLHRPFVDLVLAQAIPLAMGAVVRNDAEVTLAVPDDAGASYDLWLACLLARAGGGAWYVAERLSAWRVHDAQLTGRTSVADLLASAECWRAAADDPACARWRAPLRARCREAWRSALARALRAGDLKGLARAAARALAWRTGRRGD